MDKCLPFKNIAGPFAIKMGVDRMYEKIMRDPLLAPFFEGVDTAYLRHSQTSFILMAMGGSASCIEAYLAQVHSRLVREQGLSDVHFTALVRHLHDALSELNVAPALMKEILTLVESTRGAVLGKIA